MPITAFDWSSMKWQRVAIVARRDETPDDPHTVQVEWLEGRKHEKREWLEAEDVREPAGS